LLLRGGYRQRLLLGETITQQAPGFGRGVVDVVKAARVGFGLDLNDLARRSAVYIDKILKGANPADLPVEQASKYQLVINLKTAKALGLELPPSLLARADEVIE
jgi:ABC-type uncharacterized transport system substrate-binding protein